jgi:cytochrome b6-f complex iron-sulfur subunit
MNRREIIKRIAMGGATLVVSPLIFTSCEKEPDTTGGNNNNTGTGGNTLTVDLSLPANADLLNAGGFSVISEVIVINSAGTYIALSAKCTHSGCNVTYNSTAGNLPCPCHGSLFSTSGAVLSGPAGSPLAVYTVTKSGNILTVKM